ncbi:MAG: glycosyltransferase family 2 protein [Halobacteriales archaeon]|nr:glycosyltransferase family 2 protein [Halobacteriales archaeon]
MADEALSVTVVVPAYNEVERIGTTVRELAESYPVLVVDDGSTDDTAAVARDAGAEVIQQDTNRGYIAALKRGFREATGDIIVTYDADGEHRPSDIERLLGPLRRDELDLVIGARDRIPRPSERLLNWLTQRRVNVRDTGSGLRALRRELATTMELQAACTCGTFVLEAREHGARIGTVPIETRSIEKPRGIAWQHGRQLVYVLQYLL